MGEELSVCLLRCRLGLGSAHGLLGGLLCDAATRWQALGAWFLMQSPFHNGDRQGAGGRGGGASVALLGDELQVGQTVSLPAPHLVLLE